MCFREHSVFLIPVEMNSDADRVKMTNNASIEITLLKVGAKIIKIILIATLLKVLE